MEAIADARDEMLGWQHGGGFSLDASVRIEAHDHPDSEYAFDQSLSW